MAHAAMDGLRAAGVVGGVMGACHVPHIQNYWPSEGQLVRIESRSSELTKTLRTYVARGSPPLYRLLEALTRMRSHRLSS
eukprot:scaffold260639_cov36-Tisochrysis_lutea.AAC.2